MKKRRILWCIFIISLAIVFVNNFKTKNSQNNFTSLNDNIELAIYIDDE